MKNPYEYVRDKINHPVHKYSRAAVRGIGHATAAFMGGLGGLPEQIGEGRGWRRHLPVGHNPKSILSGSAYFAGDAVGRGLKLAGQAFGAGLGLATTASLRGGHTALKGYKDLRSFSATQKRLLREQADALERPGNASTGSRQLDRIRNRYGRVWDENKQAYGARRFGARTPMEHMGRVGKNLVDKWGPLGVMGAGLGIVAAGFMSDDNLADPFNGIVRHAASNVAFEVGGIMGAGVGAGIAAALFPVAGIAGTLIAGTGMLTGYFGGGAAASALVDLPFVASEFGLKHGKQAEARKSAFVDSEYGSTMRQRALQSVYRSQLNARSAFGQEALAYHG